MPTVFASSGDSVVEKSGPVFAGGASWSGTMRGSVTTAGSSQDSTLTNYDFGEPAYLHFGAIGKDLVCFTKKEKFSIWKTISVVYNCINLY